MKKLFLPFIFASALLFACENTDNRTETNEETNTESPLNSEENVDDHSMDNISPQLERNPDSPSRLEVDTISSAKEADKQARD